jgi:site-specific DNA-methyltransferase (adenine-specific)/site-specific DNA-methyltransferase (cytosine-N4-specific)
LYRGDCRDVLPTLAPVSLDCVVTSPPYAEQRKGFYDGVPEEDYPAFTVAWLAALRPALKERGSVLINIREHVKDGQISDYVHHTRLAVRAAGWVECDELIWIKPQAPPVGHPGRPRRSWERILWFSPSPDAWCDPRANGQPSKKIGAYPSPNVMRWMAGARPYHRGVARSPDYAVFGTGDESAERAHSASYPVTFAAWMLNLVCPPGGLVCDPFSGSGTTGVAALRLGMGYVGIEKRAEDVAASVVRLRGAASQPTIFDTEAAS